MALQQLGSMLSDLHLLTVLAQTQSFTQTARRMGLSKASVSARIAEFEKLAGVPLVRRTTRSVRLTEAGQRLVEETESSFATIADSFDSVRNLAGEPSGLVRITAPVAIGRQRVAPALPGFMKRYPEIRLELDLSDRFVNLAQEGFDLAIRHTDTPPDTYVAWRLCETQSLLVASPEYLEQHGAPAHPSELSQHQCLMYLRDLNVKTWSFEKSLDKKRMDRISVPVSGPLRANNSEVLREAVVGGAGIGLLPDFSALEALAANRIKRVLPEWRPVGFFAQHIYAIRPWSPKVPTAVRCVVEHLKETFQSN